VANVNCVRQLLTTAQDLFDEVLRLRREEEILIQIIEMMDSVLEQCKVMSPDFYPAIKVQNKVDDLIKGE